ncbi:metal-dependent hydrolase [Roseibium sediminicola]|uniref:Metal-dependent hydrolase n=1 Tax=Roseibium sediminicola TaxID=2933272 RepID=A0ABT0GZB6_9HYPH|nr:metal-dependent hydrolase [Roseibium sp. CAU 1639]MCK7614778.1 metal-dependent hydrolase [Roseibium sp. CAU 1639]
MDSLTQFVLGAAVSTALLGNKIGPRKAALIGGALGTMPDLDVFIPFDDPVDSFVYHRGWTHSVLVHALATPILGEGLVRLFKGLREHRWRVWAAVFLCLSTHAAIDAMTVYGTRILWPLYPDPVGVGSVFIIDPLYTLPLLAVVIWALCRKTWTTRLRNGLAAALIVSTGYLGLSALIQRHVETHALELFQENGGAPDRIYAIATPFNILFWKVIGLREDSYDNLYLSLLDGEGPAEIYTHPRNPELIACLEETPAFQKLDWFSRGYYRADLVGDEVVMSDLRMGLTPGYAFRFVIAEQEEAGIRPVGPERFADLARVEEGDLDWLLTRLQGKAGQRAAEAGLSRDTETIRIAGCTQLQRVSG